MRYATLRNMPKKESTADRLRRLREKAGLSLIELANKTGLHRTTLYRCEQGVPPRMGTLTELARVYKVTIGQVRGTEAWPRGGDS